MSLQNTPLQPLTPARLLHVIAKHAFATALTPHVSACFVAASVSACGVLATALTPHVSACHCEPVRTLVRQSVSPQRNLTSLCYFGQIRNAFRIRPKYCVLLCAAAGVTDCHVASLLAMTCSNLPRGPIIPGHCRCTAGKRPCTRNHAPAFCMSLRTSAWGPGTLCGERSPKGALPCSGLWPELGMADFGATTWRTLGRRGVAIRVPCPGCPLRKRPYKRNHAPAFCMSLRTSAHTGAAIRFPAEKPDKFVLLRANP